jgi:hypothetical protein
MITGSNVGIRPELSRRTTLSMTSFQSSELKGWSLLCFATAVVQIKKNAKVTAIYLTSICSYFKAET